MFSFLPKTFQFFNDIYFVFCKCFEFDQSEILSFGKEFSPLLTEHGSFLLLPFNPGVKLEGGGDNLGQQYVTPKDAILDKKSDVIIVGRGITSASDPVSAALEYKSAAYSAYQQRISQR